MTLKRRQKCSEFAVFSPGLYHVFKSHVIMQNPHSLEVGRMPLRARDGGSPWAPVLGRSKGFALPLARASPCGPRGCGRRFPEAGREPVRPSGARVLQGAGRGPTCPPHPPLSYHVLPGLERNGRSRG